MNFVGERNSLAWHMIRAVYSFVFRHKYSGQQEAKYLFQFFYVRHDTGYNQILEVNT